MINRVDIDLRVKVEKDWLLNKVKENRKEHRETFEKAFAAYREAIIKFQSEQLDRLLKAPNAVVVKYFSGTRPEDHTADYDVVIAMLEQATADDTISLTGSDFRQFVNDEWGWTRQFVSASNSYGVSTKFDKRSDMVEETV